MGAYTYIIKGFKSGRLSVLADDSLTIEEMAKRLGLTKNTVRMYRHILIKEGLLKKRRVLPRPRYPPELVEKALKLVESGESYRKIEKLLGIYYKTVEYWCKKHGVKPKIKRFPQELKEKAVKMVRSGESYYSVAKSIGVNPEVVRQWCLKSGVRSTYVKERSEVVYSEPRVVDGVTYVTTPLYDEYVALSEKVLSRSASAEEADRFQELRKLLKKCPTKFVRILDVSDGEGEPPKK